MSQKDKILNYLIAIPGRRISTWIAIKEFGCTTICQRAKELKDDLERKPLDLNGVKYYLESELVTRDGSTYSEYWLEPVKVVELQGVLF